MKNVPKTLFPVLAALVFTVVLYERSWGLNLFLFQVFVLVGMLVSHAKSPTSIQWVAITGSSIAIVFTFLYHSVYGFWFSFFSLFGLSVLLADARLKSFHLTLLAAFMSFFSSFNVFFKSLGREGKKRGVPIGRLQKASIYVLPLVLIVVFSQLYGGANPTFQQLNASIGDGLERLFSAVWRYVEVPAIFFFAFGLVLTIPLFFHRVMDFFLTQDSKPLFLFRRRNSYSKGKTIGLKQEVKVGTFLLVTLNLMLLLLLAFEIKDVWFGFDYQGEYLKSFVHGGMYMLLVSILISVGIALYFFRGNQNFYAGAAALKKLTYLWLTLNALLVLSVGIRNGWYVHYFSLAYGRIVLSFFLVACLIGIWSVFKKVRHTQNNLFLWRTNSFAVYTLLVVGCLFNWDVLIAKYNFANADRAFLHLDYMITLEDRALPYLHTHKLALENVETEQQKRLNLSSSRYQDQYLTAENYQALLERRTEVFLKKWEQKDWLEWNPAEARAYERLRKR